MAPSTAGDFRSQFSDNRKRVIAGGVVLLVVIVLGGVFAWQRQVAAANAKWNRAADAFGRADYDKAAKNLEGVDVPKSEARLRIYAQTMLATHQLDKSLVAYDRLYAINKDPSVQLIMGNIYSEQKNYAKAVEIYNKSIKDNPANAQAYVNLSTLYKMQGNQAAAIDVANQAVTNNPGSVTLHELQVSMLLNDKSKPEYKAAVKSLEKLSPADPLLTSLAKG